MNTSIVSRSATMHNPQTPIYCNGKPIGEVKGTVFHKTITGSKHLLRQPRAIAFDRSTLTDAEAAGATTARIYDRETGTAYTATLDRIRSEGFKVARGYGNQWALALDKWSANGQKPPADVKAAATNQEIGDLQLSLFGGAA